MIGSWSRLNSHSCHPAEEQMTPNKPGSSHLSLCICPHGQVEAIIKTCTDVGHNSFKNPWNKTDRSDFITSENWSSNPISPVGQKTERCQNDSHSDYFKIIRHRYSLHYPGSLCVLDRAENGPRLIFYFHGCVHNVVSSLLDFTHLRKDPRSEVVFGCSGTHTRDAHQRRSARF